MKELYKQELDRAVGRLKHLRGEAILAQLDRIVTLAEENDDAQNVVNALCEKIQAGNDLDMLEVQLASLQRLHGHYMTDPRYAFARDRVLWYHKWIAEPLVENTDVSRAAMEAMFQRLDALFTAERIGLRPSYMLRCRTAWMMDRMPEAREYFRQWQETPAGKSDDCAACELNARIEFLLADGREEEAFSAALPLFRGQMRCAEVPAITYSRLLGPALQLGKMDLAEAMRRSTARSVRKKPDLLACLARHVMYMALTGRARAVRRLMVLALGRAAKASDHNRFGAYLSAGLWFSILAREGVEQVKLPARFEPARQTREVATPAGAAWCLEQAGRLGRKFDARNGTGLYRKRVETIEQMIRAICAGGIEK